MRNTRRLASLPRLDAVALILLTGLAGIAATGCATRTVRHSLVEQNLIEIDLVREVRGFSIEPRGFQHPAIVSAERLANILGAIEVETREQGSGMIRQPAFRPEIVRRTAEHLARGLAEASPDEEVGVKTIRKERRLGIFHTKYLTSFLVYMQDDHLYLLLRRVDWPIPRGQEEDPLPEPIRSRKSMNFRVVTGEPLFFAGLQDLEIDWRNPVFQTAFRLPGSTKGEKRRREVLKSSPVPKAEIEAQNGDGVPLDQLTPEQLRALADLEEDRQAGRITETAYQRARRQLLRRR